MQFRSNLGCLWLLLIVLLIGGVPLLAGVLRVFAAFVVLTLVAGAVFSWWLRRYAVIKYTRTRRSESRRFVELLVALLVRLAEADGELDRQIRERAVTRLHRAGVFCAFLHAVSILP